MKHCIILIQLKQNVITMYSYKCVCKSWKYNILYIMHVLKYTYCHCLIEYFIMTIKLTLISLTITVKLINPILTALYFLQNYCWYDYSCGLRNFCFRPGRARGNFVCRRGVFFFIFLVILSCELWFSETTTASHISWSSHVICNNYSH